jgi:hypothetical protein
MIITESEFDASIYQDFILDDEDESVVTLIEDGYEAWVEIFEGKVRLHNSQIAKSVAKDRYEMRLSKLLTGSIFQPGRNYTLRVYEKNDSLGFKQYIHEELIKTKTLQNTN